MVLLGDETQLVACFGLFRDSANLDARSVHGFAPNVPWAQKSFSTHPMELLGDVGHVESRSVHLEMVLVLVQVGARFAPNVPKAQILFRTHPILLLGDEAQLEARFGLFGDSANLDARSVHGLRRMYHRLGNHLGRTRWNSYVTWVMWNLIQSFWRWC